MPRAVRPQCVAFTGNHVRCENQSAVTGVIGSHHLHLCATHRTQHMRRVANGAGIHPVGRCLHAIRERGDYLWCGNAPIDGSAYCQHHLDRFERDRVQMAAVAEWARGGRAGFDPIVGWRVFEDDPFIVDMRRVRADARVAVADPAPAPLPELGALALDRQNVHTGVVNDRTNDGIARLCAVPVPESQDTRRNVLHAFLEQGVPYENVMIVWQDVEQWWQTDRCRVGADDPPDQLYRRTLRGIVAYIGRVESAETRTELYRRLYQEAHEAVGMCCDGHLARLVNVLVGFDDAFRPPVSQGELIQTRIAAIAGMEDASVEERLRQANVFFDEIAYPVPERAPWLDVLAE